MLFILSGSRQVGKTRWLEALVRELEARGGVCYGVIAPGRWMRQGDGSLYKTGVDNVLLPTGERVAFAERAGTDGATGHAQSAAAGLGWDISDAAIAQVNGHLRQLREAQSKRGGLLVLDELGPLELKRGGGLTEAVALLNEGPQDAWPDAIIVVRPELVDVATARWKGAWGSVEVMAPNAAALSQLLEVPTGGLPCCVIC